MKTNTIRIRAAACLFTLAACATGASIADDPEPDEISVSGVVLDSEGLPAANVSVGSYWSANGVTHARITEFHRLAKEGTDVGLSERYGIKGIMQPWGRKPTLTDENGEFRITTVFTRSRLMLIDRDQKQGALLAARDAESSVPRIRLQPLIRVHGQVRVEGHEMPPEWAVVLMNIPRSDECPLGPRRLAMCGTLDGRFEFHMPPGEYIFESNTDPERSMMAELITEHRMTLKPGQKEYDAGTLVLTERTSGGNRREESMKEGRWFDFREHYGEPAPQLIYTEVRGVDDGVQPADFKGKWILVYAWSPWCRPCLAKGIRDLMKFQDRHAKHADRFQILSVCIDSENDLGSLNALDDFLGPVQRQVWKRTLNVPVLFDNTFENFENYGFMGAGDMALIDPNGNLAEGDIETLERILSQD